MKDKKEKVFKGMTAPVDVHLDVPDEEIWTYKIDGLAEPHINKPFTNFTLKKIVFTVLLLIAVGLSMYFSVRVVSRTPFEYNEIGDGTYEFVKFNNTGYIRELTIDYAVTIETDSSNPDASTNFTLVKDETKPISVIPQFCFNCDETVEIIYIGKDVKEIDGKAFFTCRALRQIIVDEENEYYCDIDGVLYNKDKTEIICYPMNHPQYLREKLGYNDAIWTNEDKTNLEFRARYEADVLTYVLPATVEIIGELAFYDLPLATLYMPEGLKRIETMAIMRNWWMTDIYSYESSTAEADETGFSAVAKLQGVYRSLPEGLEYIGSDAMSYCDDGALLRIPSTVKYIGHHAFFDTAEKKDGAFLGYEKVYIGMSEEEFKNVETGGQWIPEYDSGLLDKKVELVYGVEKEYETAKNYTEKEDGTLELTSVTNRELAKEFTTEDENGRTVTSIAPHAFDWDTSIETVYIGKDVTELTGETFAHLRALKKIEVDESNTSFCDVDGVLYTKDMTVLLACPVAYEGGSEFVVPETVTTIGRAAFMDCKFEKISLPEGLSVIERHAFLKAESLKEIVSYKGEETYNSLPEGLEVIGVDAFNYASALTYLYIPASIKDLGAYCFTYCARVDENGNKIGVTEVDVALAADAFKNVKAGEHWSPEFRNAEDEVAVINYGAERK